MTVRNCDVCQQSYVTHHMQDGGICRLCEIRETAWRNRIADETRIIMDDYRDNVLARIRQTIALKSGNDL